VPPGSPLPAVRLAVLVSGAGTILEAMPGAGLPVDLVVADRPCRAIDWATAAGLTTLVLDRAAYGWPRADWDRPAFTAALVGQLREHRVQLIAMAGFMTILSPSLFTAFPDRVLNTHPSLLPDFPGAHAVADALAAGVPTTGCTVHLATAALDNGPILAQTPVPVRPGDTPSILQERIKTVERRLYPAVIKSYGAALIRGTAPSK
jgi:phosphoribosylglycinamide formyltransferase-1